MHIDSYFSLSNSSLGESEFVVIGIPYDSTQSFIPGSRFLPNAVREASWNLESYSMLFDFDFNDVKICDAGNINVDGTFIEIVERVGEFYEKINAIPIAIGGEHTISYACAKNFDNVCYIAFDAHLDLRDEFDGSRFNHACTVRRVCEEIENVILIGVRSGTKEERDFAENNIEVFYSWDVMEKGVNWIVDRLECKLVYLSLDVDVFDPAFVHVSTPEPAGLFPMHFLQFLKKFKGKIVGFDVVEGIPDNEKRTQMLVARMIFEFIARSKRF